MNKTFKAEWDAVPDADSIIIRWKINNAIQPSVNLTGDATTHEAVLNVENGDTVSYTVQAANAVGSSPVSESPSITVSGLASPPPAPTGLTAPVMLD